MKIYEYNDKNIKCEREFKKKLNYRAVELCLVIEHNSITYTIIFVNGLLQNRFKNIVVSLVPDILQAQQRQKANKIEWSDIWTKIGCTAGSHYFSMAQDSLDIGNLFEQFLQKKLLKFKKKKWLRQKK